MLGGVPCSGIIETSSGEVDQCLAEIRPDEGADDQAVRRHLPIFSWPYVAAGSFDLVAESGVKFVIRHPPARPAKLLPTLKAAGLHSSYHVVPNLTSALKAVDAGVDGLIVEGGEGVRLQESRRCFHPRAPARGAGRADQMMPIMRRRRQYCDGRGMARRPLR